MKIFETRNEMVQTLVKPNGVYGEIGIFKGEFSKYLMGILQPSTLVLFDLFESMCGSGDVDGNNFCMTDMGNEYYNISDPSNPNLKLIKGDSSTQLSRFTDGYFGNRPMVHRARNQRDSGQGRRQQVARVFRLAEVRQRITDRQAT